MVLGDIYLRFTWQAWQAWHLLHLVMRLVAVRRPWSPGTPRQFVWQAWHLETSTVVSPGRCGTWRHLPAFHVAGVALGDIYCSFTWQAWHFRQVPRLPRKVQLHVAKNKLCDETVHKLCVQVPRLPRETKVDVSKCHACHAKCGYMSPSATPATQKAAATTAARGNPARHQSQPSAIRATPATQSDDP